MCLEPGEGFFHAVAVGDAVDCDHAVSCPVWTAAVVQFLPGLLSRRS